MNNLKYSYQKKIDQNILTHKLLIKEYKHIKKAIELISSCLNKSAKILICGNGGSAADSQHLAAELVGKFNL